MATYIRCDKCKKTEKRVIKKFMGAPKFDLKPMTFLSIGNSPSMHEEEDFVLKYTDYHLCEPCAAEIRNMLDE